MQRLHMRAGRGREDEGRRAKEEDEGWQQRVLMVVLGSGLCSRESMATLESWLIESWRYFSTYKCVRVALVGRITCLPGGNLENDNREGYRC